MKSITMSVIDACNNDGISRVYGNLKYNLAPLDRPAALRCQYHLNFDIAHAIMPPLPLHETMQSRVVTAVVESRSGRF
jgi:hypothetical protein